MYSPLRSGTSVGSQIDNNDAYDFYVFMKDLATFKDDENKQRMNHHFYIQILRMRYIFNRKLELST